MSGRTRASFWGALVVAVGPGVAGCDYTVGYYRDGGADAFRDAPSSGGDSGTTDGPGASDACACPTLFDPVCGSDGVTYTNACLASCLGIKVDCGGSCPCATGFPCGGFGGMVCPSEYDCVDDLSDACDPLSGSDCPGLCAPRNCAGDPGIPCPEHYLCADDPSDGCDPAGGLDCPGICVPAR